MYTEYLCKVDGIESEPSCLTVVGIDIALSSRLVQLRSSLIYYFNTNTFIILYGFPLCNLLLETFHNKVFLSIYLWNEFFTLFLY